jgi:hypothetical protein
MDDEGRLREKLQAIEALFAGATTEGERDAADRARRRIAARIAEVQGEQLVEWQFSLDPWSYRLLMALARRYGLGPYRYRRQRRMTLMIKAPDRFMTETFLPEYRQMKDLLHQHLTVVTERVVAEALNSDKSEPTTVDSEPRQLEAFTAKEEG